MTRPIGRRDFLHTAATITSVVMTGALPTPTFADEKKPKLKKAVKYGMVQVKGGAHHERLELARSVVSWVSRSIAPARPSSMNL